MNRMMKIIAGGFVLSAAITAHAGENLIKNGTFDDVTVPTSGTGADRAWGAYAYASGFRCANWTFYNSDDGGVTKLGSTAGLCKPSSTWTAMTAAQIGSFALFIQASNKVNAPRTAYVEQSIGTITAGVYRVTFTYAVRASASPITTYIELINDDGGVFSVDSVNTTSTAAQSFSKDILLPSGTYTFRFREPFVNTDRANIFEGVSVVRLDDDLAGAMRAAVSSDVLLFDTDGAGNATLADATIAWSGNMPTANVPGTLTVSGANTIAAYASTPGTYTLITAGSIVLEEGATLALDSPAVTDGLVRTLNVGANAVTLTVALDPARTEMVIDGDFDMPGVSYGATRNEVWGGYMYRRDGSVMPWWQCGSYLEGAWGESGCGLGKADGTWLVAGQTNGGVYSYFMQTGSRSDGTFKKPGPLVQDFGATPAGIYRFKFNYATRPSHTGLNVAGAVRKDGTTIHTALTAPTTNTKLEELSQVVALPSAGNYGVAFDVQFKESADRGAVVDDVSFLRTTVPGWGIADGVVTLSGPAEVPARSFVDGDAEIASGATLAMEGDPYVAGLTVAGTLTVKGTVTITLPSAYDAMEANFVLVKADSLVFDEGASFVIDPDQISIDNETYVRYAVLDVVGNTVVLRMFAENPTTNNYRKSAAACVDTLWQTPGNWSRDHAPTNGDGNVIFNNPGTILFDNVYTNTAKLNHYFRNGRQAPVVFDATSDENGYEFNGDYIMGVGGGKMAGWTEFRRGTYNGIYFYVNGKSGGGVNSWFRLDFTGATVNLVNCIQCGYSVESDSEMNVSAGTVNVLQDFNPNISARTTHRLRITGGVLRFGDDIQACSGVDSVFDAEITGGELDADVINVAYSAVGSHGELRVSGGVVRANGISAPAGYGEFIFNGGALAPHAMSVDWMNGARLTVAAGKSAIVDTEGNDVTWSATVADVSGGVAYGFVKRGAGTLTFPGAQTFTGAISVEGGTLFAPVALAASSLYVTNGATYSVADGTAGQTFTLNALALDGGGRLAIDVTDEESDTFASEALDISGASSANPVLIVVNPVGIAELPMGVDYTVIASGLSSGDETKFAASGIDARLAVVNGALVMRSSNRLKVTTEWSGAANNGGKWTTGDNWTGGEAPQNGDTAAFNLAAGGATDFDIVGLALGGLVFGQDAGSFRHGGAEQLRVANALTNASANAQTFTAPTVLGVAGQPFELETAGDTVFTGVTSIAASTLTKKGAGTLAVPGPTVLTAQRIEVDAGTLRIDERAASLDAPVTGDIVVRDGARLDLNAASTVRDIQKNEMTRSKTVSIEGSGPDGAGALYNSVPSGGVGSSHFSRLVLTGDAKTGGANVTVRGAMAASASAYTDASITGPYTLTVANAGESHCDSFFVANSALDLTGIHVTGSFLLEGTISGNVANGVRISDGSSFYMNAASVPATIPFSVDAGATVVVTGQSAANTVNGPITIGTGATVNVTPDQPITFNGAVTNAGTFVQAKSGNIYFDCPELVGGTYEVRGNHVWFGGAIDSPESEIAIRGASASAGIIIFGAQSTLPGTGLPNFKAINVTGPFAEVRFMPRAACEITNSLYDAVVANAGIVYIDSVEHAAATVTVKNATWTTKGDFRLGSVDGRGSYFKIADGATLTVASGHGLYTANGVSNPYENVLEVASGGVLNYPGANNYFQIGRGYSAPDENALPQRLVVSGGTVNMPTAQLLIGAYTRTAYADLTAGLLAVQQLQPRQTATYIANWKSAYDVRFTQTGGVLELGSGGSVSAIPGVDKPYLDLAGGTLRATANLSNKYGYMNIQFGASPASDGEYTVDLNGNTVNWNAPLAGAGDVTVTGEGAFNSLPALQSIPLGKWTVTNTTAVANLSGAAGFAGGLTVAPGKSAKIAVPGEGLVEWAFFNNNQIADMNALKAYTGVCPYVNSTLGHVHLSFGSNVAPMGNYSRFVYRGQFYVEADKAGTWYFGVNYDDNITLVIDGVDVASSTAYNVVGTGSVELAEGWHDFRICVLDGSGSCGPYVSGWSNTMGVGWSTDAAAEGSTVASAYTKFDTTTLAMRLPQGAATQTAVRMKAAPVSDGSTYMNETQPFTLCDSVTNNLALLHNLNADSVASVANSQTVHYEGYFLVPEENAGSWTFTGQYDDYLTLEVDGVRRFSTGGASKSATATFALSAGWHSFRIAVVDGTGSYGGKLTDDNGKVCALKAKPANGAKTLAFDGGNFRLAYSAVDAQKMCAAGLGGEIDVGEGATLQNAAVAGYCPIYGTLKGSGTLSGAFRFTGTTNCWKVTQASVRELARVEFANPTKETFTGLKALNVTFNDKPAKALYYLTTATVDGLTETDLEGTAVTVTDGEHDYSANFALTVRNGRLALANSKPGGIVVIVR